MNCARKISVVAFAVLVLAAGSVSAQEWSAEQTEVWETVQTFWEVATQKDLEASMAVFHPAYSGWSYNWDYPNDKASSEKWAKYYYETSTWVIYELKPIGITVVDDIAIVHYFYFGMYTDLAKEEDESAKGRWTDIYKKEGDTWLLIADHGGQTKDK